MKKTKLFINILACVAMLFAGGLMTEATAQATATGSSMDVGKANGQHIGWAAGFFNPAQECAVGNAQSCPRTSELDMSGPIIAAAGGSGPIVEVQLDVDYDHTWVDDIQIYLVSPEGTEVHVRENQCGSQNGVEARYNDNSGIPNGAFCGTFPKTGGNFSEQETFQFGNDGIGLNDFVGEDPSGVWELKWGDDAGQDGGTLQGWSLQIMFTPPINCDVVCPPDTLFYDLDPLECDVIVNYYSQPVGDECGVLTICDIGDPTVDRQTSVALGNNAVRCNPVFGQSATRMARVYSVPAGNCGPSIVTGIEAGIHPIGALGGGSDPFNGTARIYSIPFNPIPGSFAPGALTLLAEVDVVVTAASATQTSAFGNPVDFYTFDFPAPVMFNPGDVYVVELEADNNNGFYHDGNFGGQSSPTYINCPSFSGIFPNYDNVGGFAVNVAAINANSTMTTTEARLFLEEGQKTGSRFGPGCTFNKLVLLADDPDDPNAPKVRVDSCEFEVCVNEFPDPGSVSCNDNVQVSLDPNCQAVVLPDDILEGSYGCVDDFLVEVLDHENPNVGNVLPTSPMVTGNEIGSTLAVRVTDTETNTSCWGTITVEDKTPPTIVCPPDASIGCDSLAWLLAFDPNDIASTNTFVSTDVPVDIPANSANTQTSTLVVPPNFKRVNTSDVNVAIEMPHTWLADMDLILESPNGTSVTLMSGQCGADDDLNTIFDDEGDTWDCALRNDGIRLTPPNGSLSDFDGINPVGQWTLTLRDNVGADGGTLVAWSIELSTVSQFQRPDVEDGCCLDNVYYEDEENVDPCGTGTVTRTWYAVDCYKNESSCVQTFTVIPNDPPGIIFPQDLEFDCPQTADNLKPSDIEALPPNVVDNNGLVARNQARPRVTNQDYCGNIAFNFEDQLFDVCLPYGFKIRRTWTAVDWCDPDFETSQIQIIKVIDDERPAITCPQDKTISTTHTDCFTFLSPDPIQATDNCDPTPSVTSVTYLDESGTVILPSPQVGPGNYIIKYEVSDDCGNKSACQQRVTVVDNVPPVAICDVNTQISLTAVNGWADLCASVINDGSYDNCGPITIEIRAPNLPFPQNVWSPCVRFFCTNIGDHIVELRVTDEAGNYNICWANVSVEDKLPPSIICPSDVTVDCTVDFLDPANTGGEAQGLSACGGVEVDYVDLGITSCVGTFTRRWTASKEIDTHSGPVTLTATCDQQITVVDNTPASVEFPEDITLDCPAVGTDPASLSQFNFTDQFGVFHFFDKPALDYDCEQLGVSSEDEIFDICLPAGYKIRRTWHVVDWCDPNFDITHVQVIKVRDVGNPEIFVNGSQNYNVFAQITNNNPNCEMYVDLVATATDDCSAVSISNDSPYSDSGNGFDASGYYPKGTHNFTFTAIDDCGNITERDITVTVVDAKDPSPVCLTVAVNIKSTKTVTVTPQALVGDDTQDNCTDVSNLTYQLELTDADDSAPVGANPQDELVFTCDDLGPQYVRLWVFDASNNGDYCVTSVLVQDNNGYCGSTASGFIAATTQTADGEDIDDVNIYVNNAIAVPGMFGTQTFNFQAGNVMVEAEKDINLLNGVSTLDIILIRKHILGIDPFDSPYKWVAADIDHSESISTIDIVHLRKAILNLTDEFKDNTSWRFIDEAYTFTTQNPLGEDFPEYVQDNLAPGETLEADFVGVKIGDVSGNATPNSLVGTQDRNANGTMLMNVDAAELTSGEEYTVEFKANDIAQIAGYQFTLEFDASAIEFVGLEPGALNKLTEENFGLNRVSEGVITTSWDALSGAQLNDDEVVFTITFRALDQVNLSEVLYISSRYTRAEAYTTGSDLKDVALEFVTETGASDEFALYQNRPNPFANNATIGFDLPEAGSAMMTIYDLSGKVVKQIEGDYAKGYNEVVIKSSELHGAGVLYYELVSGEYKATKKMIVIE